MTLVDIKLGDIVAHNVGIQFPLKVIDIKGNVIDTINIFAVGTSTTSIFQKFDISELTKDFDDFIIKELINV